MKKAPAPSKTFKKGEEMQTKVYVAKGREGQGKATPPGGEGKTGWAKAAWLRKAAPGGRNIGRPKRREAKRLAEKTPGDKKQSLPGSVFLFRNSGTVLVFAGESQGPDFLPGNLQSAFSFDLCYSHPEWKGFSIPSSGRGGKTGTLRRLGSSASAFLWLWQGHPKATGLSAEAGGENKARPR